MNGLGQTNQNESQYHYTVVCPKSQVYKENGDSKIC